MFIAVVIDDTHEDGEVYHTIGVYDSRDVANRELISMARADWVENDGGYYHSFKGYLEYLKSTGRAFIAEF